jgi:hypothetical protein
MPLLSPLYPATQVMGKDQFVKGGEGGFSQGVPKQIPLFPPFSKGDLKAINYLRISS